MLIFCYLAGEELEGESDQEGSENAEWSILSQLIIKYSMCNKPYHSFIHKLYSTFPITSHDISKVHF